MKKNKLTDTNPLLLIDYYKAVHHDQYPKGITKLVSYFTPRMSRLPFENKVVMFGLQYFIKRYLIDYFNDNFFNVKKSVILKDYKRTLDNTLGVGIYDLQKIADLWDLGYLPLQIKALPEGTRVPLHVPMLEITNTHPKFAWLVNTIESLMSAELWHPMISGNVGYWYKKIVNEFYGKTCDDNISRERALGDFSFRGQESYESATVSSAGFCLSFYNTATVPALHFFEKYYHCNSDIEPVIFGAISTEHSVMCSNTAIDGDERTFVKRMLTELYPTTSFSMVSDSYDYWNLVDNILPTLKEEVLAHKGCLLIRGDSGDPVDIITQTVYHLWDIFGGTVNSKGYKVLDPHVKALYGDSITIQRCRKIYETLEAAGFAASNVALGVGSFSMQCVELEDGTLAPFTRDTFGMAVKATYCEVDGKAYPIFKNPKTDTAHFKVSQKGMCIPFYKDGVLTYQDGFTKEDYNYQSQVLGNAFITVFKDGKMREETSLRDIRERLSLQKD